MRPTVKRPARSIATDVMHYLLGALSYFIPPIAILFFLYQAVEKEPTMEKACDYLEFFMGLATACLIMKSV